MVEWVEKSGATSTQWVVAVDEPGDASAALRPDNNAGNSHTDGRKNGSITSVNGGGNRSLGNPPNNTTQDWVILVSK